MVYLTSSFLQLHPPSTLGKSSGFHHHVTLTSLLVSTVISFHQPNCMPPPHCFHLSYPLFPLLPVLPLLPLTLFPGCLSNRHSPRMHTVTASSRSTHASLWWYWGARLVLPPTLSWQPSIGIEEGAMAAVELMGCACRPWCWWWWWRWQLVLPWRWGKAASCNAVQHRGEAD